MDNNQKVQSSLEATMYLLNVSFLKLVPFPVKISTRLLDQESNMQTAYICLNKLFDSLLEQGLPIKDEK